MTNVIHELNPGVLLIVGALAMPLLPHIARGLWALVLPLVAGWAMLQLPLGEAGAFSLFSLNLVTLRVDKLALAFGTVFIIAAFLAGLYALHVRSWLQPMAALMYAGSAIGAVFAGDLITFFVFWEITAITSVFLIWADSTERAYEAGMRYLLVQVTAGVLLLAGVMVHAHETGGIAFTAFSPVMVGALDEVSLSVWLILIAVGIKAAFPLLHMWLPDAYPAATLTGTVWLSAFTTKLAIYALVRGFPGSDILIPIGALMAVGMIAYAALVNDMRRILSYALISQLGFMTIGVGIGSDLALNGSVAHAFCSTLYQALLFMAVGALVMQTGTNRLSEVGGLARAMPWTTAFLMIGALSIAAAPAFSGFVSKSLIMSAAMKKGAFVGWMAMILASGAVMLHAGLRLPYYACFQGSAPPDAKEAPLNMMLAMGATAVLCVGIGAYPAGLYILLPFDVGYEPYTGEHIVTQFQLLAFGALAFFIMTRMGLLKAPQRGRIVDADWLTRVLGYNIASTFLLLARGLWNTVAKAVVGAFTRVENTLSRANNPDSILGRPWPTGLMAFWATAMLGAYLVLFYFRQFAN